MAFNFKEKGDGLVILTPKKTFNLRMVKWKNRWWKFSYNRKEKIMKISCGVHFGVFSNVTQISTSRTRLV